MSTWEQTTLDKLGKIGWGVQRHTPKDDKSLFEDGTIPFVEENLVKPSRLHISDCTKRYNEVGLKQSKLFPKDTVCITNNGRISSIILSSPSCLCTQLHGFNSFENISDSKFIKYCFNFSKIWKKLMNISSIGGKHLTLEKILKIPFPNPPFELQKKIGQIISIYDLLIENYEKQIDLLKNQRTKLFQRWFVQHKFPTQIDSDLSSWKKLSLKDLVAFKGGKKLSENSRKDGIYPFFTWSRETQKINEYSFDQEALLFCLTGKRHIKYYCGKFDLMQHVYALSTKHEYFWWLFETINYFVPHFDKMAKGVTVPRLSIEIVKKFEINLPPDNLLNLFNQFAEPIQKHIDSLSKQIDTFQVIKQELIERIYSQNLDINF